MADALFRWPDFRAPERAFQILKQVAGRAGRGEKEGRVLIQSYDLDHPVLRTLTSEMSEASFIEAERSLRQALGYPPFGRLARLRFESTSRQDSMDRANAVMNQMRQVLHRELNPENPEHRTLEILGPSDAFLERAKSIYRWDLLLKSKNFQTLQKAVIFGRNFCAQQKWQILIDVDPYSI
jgi:primosomal protein N' (replication factor Y)